MDFYNQLLAQKLSGGGGGGDSNAAFKALVDKSITEVTSDMLQGITTIGESAFYKCQSLTSITIPNSVTIFRSSAFSGCSNLTSITIQNTSTGLPSYIFYNCINLTYVEIQSGRGTIGSSAFENCQSLPNIEIPEGFTNIDYAAFRSCTSLTSIDIPSTASGISYPFPGCTSLANVTVKALQPPKLGNNAVFDGVSQNLVIYVPAASVETYKAAQYWSTYADKIQAIPSE